jgi:hypothetical protein
MDDGIPRFIALYLVSFKLIQDAMSTKQGICPVKAHEVFLSQIRLFLQSEVGRLAKGATLGTMILVADRVSNPCPFWLRISLLKNRDESKPLSLENLVSSKLRVEYV